MEYIINRYYSFSKELKSLWKLFEDNADCYVFQTYGWCQHWFEVVGNSHGNCPLIYVISDQKNIISILPFVKTTKFGFTSLEWMGGIQSDYKAPLLKKDYKLLEPEFASFWGELQNYLKEEGVDFCHFKNQPEFI